MGLEPEVYYLSMFKTYIEFKVIPLNDGYIDLWLFIETFKLGQLDLVCDWKYFFEWAKTTFVGIQNITFEWDL